MSITLETTNLIAKFTVCGASLTHFIVKSLNYDIVAGFDDPESYLTKNSPYFGSVIGRVCNRFKEFRSI